MNDELRKRVEIFFNAIHNFNLQKYTLEDVKRITPIIIDYARNYEEYNTVLHEICEENGCDIDSFSYQEYGVRHIVEKVNNVRINFSGPNVCVPKR